MFVRHMTGPRNCSGSMPCPVPHSCSLLSSSSQHASSPCLLQSQGMYPVPPLCWRVQSQGNWKDLGCQEVDDLPDTKLPQRLQCRIQSHGFLQLLSWTASCSDQYWSQLDQIFTQRRANNVSWWVAGWSSHVVELMSPYRLFFDCFAVYISHRKPPLSMHWNAMTWSALFIWINLLIWSRIWPCACL